MQTDILWWHWVAFGILLSLVEVFLPSFTVIWFGIGALLTGIAVMLSGIGPSLQFLFWALSASAMAAFWFLFVHPRVGSTKPSQVQPDLGFNLRLLFWALSASVAGALWLLFVYPRTGSRPGKVHPG